MAGEQEAADTDDVVAGGALGELEASLRSALATLRENADRLAQLSGDEQVAVAEQLAVDAAKLDEQLGAMARDDDD